MTHLLYYDDAYLNIFSAQITQVAGEGEQRRVALDQTAFYPGGGGQPCDTGKLMIDGQPVAVTQVKKQDGVLWHWLADPAGAAIHEGMDAVGEVDWDRRYRIMRTHTAMHILCGVVWRDYGASVTGGNMDPGAGRMDFEFAAMSRELVTEIETSCNREIQAARPVRAQILPREEAFQIPDLIRTKINLLPPGIPEVRTIELVGLDLQADGGTHVRNTSEVIAMRITDYKSKGAINKRIYVELRDE